MQKRVAVARSLVLETEVLIYDEPTTGLDPITTQTVDELIQEAEEKFGVTSIVISHDMASVFRIADYITFLYFGEIQASGTPRELLESLNEPTLRFIRASGVSEEILQGRRKPLRLIRADSLSPQRGSPPRSNPRTIRTHDACFPSRLCPLSLADGRGLRRLLGLAPGRRRLGRGEPPRHRRPGRGPG